MTLSLLWIAYEPCRCYLSLYNIGYIFFPQMSFRMAGRLLRDKHIWGGRIFRYMLQFIHDPSLFCSYIYFFPYHKMPMSFRLPFLSVFLPFTSYPSLPSLSPSLSHSVPPSGYSHRGDCTDSTSPWGSGLCCPKEGQCHGDNKPHHAKYA